MLSGDKLGPAYQPLGESLVCDGPQCCYHSGLTVLFTQVQITAALVFECEIYSQRRAHMQSSMIYLGRQAWQS